MLDSQVSCFDRNRLISWLLNHSLFLFSAPFQIQETLTVFTVHKITSLSITALIAGSEARWLIKKDRTAPWRILLLMKMLSCRAALASHARLLRELPTGRKHSCLKTHKDTVCSIITSLQAPSPWLP